MATPELRPDCARCAALCCIALDFDRSEWFALDKLAGVPCPNIDARHRCTIHGALAERGFAGCVRFDCHGAGQRVVQELFGGRSWRDDPDILPAMMDAFRGMRLVHELLLLLVTAADLPLSQEQAQKRAELEGSLQPQDSWALASLTAFEQSGLPDEVRAFLRSLGDAADQRRLRRREANWLNASTSAANATAK